MFFTRLVTLFAATASAYKVLTPALNSTVAKGQNLEVKWSSVDTDAPTFSIYLSNFDKNHWPPQVLSLAQNVPQGAGSLSVRIPCDISSDYGWQINFINGTNTYVIYAQSPIFSLTGDCVEPTPTPIKATNVTATVTSVVTAVQTVSYSNPVVWFVQPTNLVSAAAICPGGPQQTVTVYQQAPTCGVTSAAKPIISSVPAYGYNTTVPATKTVSSASTGFARTPSASISQFTGAAVAHKVGGGVAMLAGALAIML